MRLENVVSGYCVCTGAPCVGDMHTFTAGDYFRHIFTSSHNYISFPLRKKIFMQPEAQGSFELTKATPRYMSGRSCPQRSWGGIWLPIYIIFPHGKRRRLAT